MILKILLIVGIVGTSIVFGFSIGIRHGIEISMATAIKGTVKTLAEKFDELGMKDTFKTVVDDTFDSTKLNFWEDEE